MNKSPDLIILITEKTMRFMRISLPYIHKHIQFQKCICIGNICLKDYVENELKCVFLDEDKVFEGMTLEKVKKCIWNRGGNSQRAGWYFQQFIKMAFSFIADGDCYIVWDSDTVPLSDIRYFEGSQYIFITKKEFHKPYFDTMEKLLGGGIWRYHKTVSFIAENMIIDTAVMKELIKKIEFNKDIPGYSFYEKILNAINLEDLNQSGFSEFETYGNYVMKFHKEKYKLERKRTLRLGVMLAGLKPKDGQFSWLSKDYDIVTIENKAKSVKGILWISWFSLFFKPKWMRTVISAKKAARIAVKINRIQALILGMEAIDYDIDI